MQTNAASGITSPVYTALVGLLSSCWVLLGYDGGGHMMEETQSADAVGGRIIPWAVIAGAVSGLIYLVSITMCGSVSKKQRTLDCCGFCTRTSACWGGRSGSFVCHVTIVLVLHSLCWVLHTYSMAGASLGLFFLVSIRLSV